MKKIIIAIIILCCFCCAIFLPDHFKSKEKSVVVIDTDVGLDDAAAFMLAKHLGVDITYYICTEGNTSVDGVVRNVSILDKYLQLDAKKVRGCEVHPDSVGDFYGEDGLANLSQQMMKDYGITSKDIENSISLDEFKRELGGYDHITYIAIAPLITLADLIQDEDIKNRIDHVYIMGGGIEKFNSSDDSEFNFHENPEAVQKVLSSGLDLTLIPLDVTMQQQINEHQIKVLESSGKYSEFIDIFRFVNSRNLEYDNIDAAILHDTLPVLYVANPDKFTVENVKIVSDENGHLGIDDAGNDIHLVVDMNSAFLYDSLKKSFGVED